MMVDASCGNFGSHTVSLVLRSTILSRSLLDLPGWLLRIFLGQFGVAKALAEANVPDRCLMLGSSAGALAACGMVLGLDFDTIASFALDCVDRTHGKIAPAFRLHKYISECLDRQFASFRDQSPGTTVEDQLAGRVSVTVTTLPFFKSRRYTAFESPEHVKAVLLASCCMSPLAGWPFQLDGAWVFDGGVAEFTPMGPHRTVTVSPFVSSATPSHVSCNLAPQPRVTSRDPPLQTSLPHSTLLARPAPPLLTRPARPCLPCLLEPVLRYGRYPALSLRARVVGTIPPKPPRLRMGLSPGLRRRPVLAPALPPPSRASQPRLERPEGPATSAAPPDRG